MFSKTSTRTLFVEVSLRLFLVVGCVPGVSTDTDTQDLHYETDAKRLSPTQVHSGSKPVNLYHWTRNELALKDPKSYVASLIEGAHWQNQNGDWKAGGLAGHGLYLSADMFGSSDYGHILIKVQLKPNQVLEYLPGHVARDIPAVVKNTQAGALIFRWRASDTGELALVVRDKSFVEENFEVVTSNPPPTTRPWKDHRLFSVLKTQTSFDVLKEYADYFDTFMLLEFNDSPYADLIPTPTADLKRSLALRGISFEIQGPNQLFAERLKTHLESDLAKIQTPQCKMAFESSGKTLTACTEALVRDLTDQGQLGMTAVEVQTLLELGDWLKPGLESMDIDKLRLAVQEQFQSDGGLERMRQLISVHKELCDMMRKESINAWFYESPKSFDCAHAPVQKL